MYVNKLNPGFPWQSGTQQGEYSIHYTWSKAFYGTENGTLLKMGQKYLGRFEYVVLEKEGKDYLDRSCEK